MEKLFAKVYKEKLEDGTIEKIISEKIEEIVKNEISNIFCYGSESRKLLERKLEPIICGTIEDSNLGDYQTKIVAIINQAIKDDNLSKEYNTIAERLKTLFNYKSKYQNFQTVNVTEIFEDYIEFIKNDSDESESITCEMEIDYDDTIHLKNDKYDCLNYILKTYESYKDEFHIHDSISQKNIRELQRMNEFELQLLELENKFCKLNFDSHYKTAEIYFDFD